jgi:hypothetical protein
MRAIDGLTDVLSVASYADSNLKLELPAAPNATGFTKIASYPFTQNANAYNRTFFHATSGYVGVWDDGDADLALSVDQSVAAPSYVAFRVAQVAGDAQNAALLTRVLTVDLMDAQGHVASAASDWNAQPIPLWYERPPWLDSDDDCAPVPAEKTVLGTVFMPVSCFTGDAGFALEQLTRLHFHMGQGPGALAITDVQLVSAP